MNDLRTRNTSQPLVRVERGHAEPEELAALTAVLLARATAAGENSTARVGRRAVWRRPELRQSYAIPSSWRS
ncbi:acyl-CoA carboxylase epsilon subunit [Streptomyces prunicolor]|uniref:acyl-CoA carboxylase epsilon subunit n=1 Tax=Streptomyces prunicolor TaxID=67348 RepID=UPI0034461981